MHMSSTIFYLLDLDPSTYPKNILFQLFGHFLTTLIRTSDNISDDTLIETSIKLVQLAVQLTCLAV